eukprot:800286_1
MFAFIDKHNRRSQLRSQWVKCCDDQCKHCKPPRSNYFNVVRTSNNYPYLPTCLPITRDDKTGTLKTLDPKETRVMNHRNYYLSSFIESLAFTHRACCPDLYNPAVPLEAIEKRTCKCGLYFVSISAKDRHIKMAHKNKNASNSDEKKDTELEIDDALNVFRMDTTETKRVVSLYTPPPNRTLQSIFAPVRICDVPAFCNFDALDVEGDICMEHLFETSSAILQSRESAKNRRDESVTHQVPRKEFKMMEREDLYSSSDDEIHVQFRKQRSDALKNVMPSLRKKWQRQKKKKKKPKAKKKTNAKKKTKAKEKSKKSKKSKNKRNTNSNNNNKRQVDDDGSSCSSSDDDVPIR